jgi:crossover junction endonuclease MUS81
MELVVDTREHAILRLLPESTRVEALNVGDFAIRDKETGQTVMLVERKSVKDLVSSIIDGRFHEQKWRMKFATTCRILFVIEGDSSILSEKERKMVQTATLGLVAD